MRNAAATFEDDAGWEASPRRGAPRRPRSQAPAKKRKAKGPRFDMNKVARWSAIGMGATMAVGIMVNALMLQKGHHPAPLFGGVAAAVARPASAVPAAAVPTPTRTARAEAAPVDDAPVAVATARSSNPVGKAASGDPSDAIGNLIAGGVPAARAKIEGKAAGKPEKADGRTVADVQRALTKLGFKVPATGTAGPATRKAVEAFEKSHHLPVKGEVDRRLVKILAAESKTRID